MSNERILIVEDDVDLSGVMRDYLQNDGYEVKQAFTGKDGIDFSKSFNPALVLLDIMLPQVDGIEVCRTIRQSSHAPILMISAKSSDMDKMLSLGVGADDYLTKPFSLIEMVARVKAHIRRFTSFQGETAEAVCIEDDTRVFGALTIYPKSYRVTANQEEISLTSREFKILDFLSANPSQVFSKEQLAEQIWGFQEYVDDNTIAVYIGRLREKLKKAGVCYVKTVWGVGYKWEL